LYVLRAASVRRLAAEMAELDMIYTMRFDMESGKRKKKTEISDATPLDWNFVCRPPIADFEYLCIFKNLPVSQLSFFVKGYRISQTRDGKIQLLSIE
jgi:hypothetical protein